MCSEPFLVWVTLLILNVPNTKAECECGTAETPVPEILASSGVTNYDVSTYFGTAYTDKNYDGFCLHGNSHRCMPGRVCCAGRNVCDAVDQLPEACTVYQIIPGNDAIPGAVTTTLLRCNCRNILFNPGTWAQAAIVEQVLNQDLNLQLKDIEMTVLTVQDISNGYAKFTLGLFLYPWEIVNENKIPFYHLTIKKEPLAQNAIVAIISDTANGTVVLGGDAIATLSHVFSASDRKKRQSGSDVSQPICDFDAHMVIPGRGPAFEISSREFLDLCGKERKGDESTPPPPTTAPVTTMTTEMDATTSLHPTEPTTGSATDPGTEPSSTGLEVEVSTLLGAPKPTDSIKTGNEDDNSTITSMMFTHSNAVLVSSESTLISSGIQYC